MSNFKLAHLSDIHAEYRTARHTNEAGVNLREQDGYDAFEKCVDQIIEHECDAVVVCGDTFHTPTPGIRAIVFVQEQLRRFANAKIPVYMLAGNHDQNDIKADIAASKVLDDPWRKIYSHAEPYVQHQIADGINLHLVSHHMYGEQADTMSSIKPVKDEINIFSTHGSCIDPLLQAKLHAEQSPREIVIPDFLLQDIDWSYTLLGHIHERGWVGSKDKKSDTSNTKVYYNGSLIRRGYSDKEVPLGRGWTLWTIDSSGNFTPEPKMIPQRPQFDFKVIDASEHSSSDITQIVLSNLESTKTESGLFIPETAPILRQRIINLTPSKHTSLDWKAINNNSKHAFQWALKPLRVSEIDDDDESPSKIIKTLEGGDVVKLYDDWVEKTSSLELVTENIRKDVKKRARKYIEEGQELTLNDE